MKEPRLRQDNNNILDALEKGEISPDEAINKLKE